MSISFIKTETKPDNDQDRWDLAENIIDKKTHARGETLVNPCGIPSYGSGKHVPVIACIGSSRDGKSTLLNNLYKYYSIKTKLSSKKTHDIPNNIYPFKSQSGDIMTTNGIDYVSVQDECILMDCQGMALKDAKYDHYLTLIVYLTSDIIILNVRQRLDLQVLNNLLAVFSFLSEIPPESRRPDKPTLVIRIKDFQEFEALENDPDYLKKNVNKWLEKSGDQYDQIKEAFNMAFDIDIVYTEYPMFPPRKSSLDLYDKCFEKNNPSFYEACTYIMKLASSRNLKENKLLMNNDNVRQLVKTLKSNTNINYKKLDLYHNITSLELERYVSSNINITPYNNETLINQMNGSLSSYELYSNRLNEIKLLMTDTYDNKFKDIPLELKDEIFKKWFDKFENHCKECEKRNIELARAIIEPHITTFSQKFTESSNPFTDLVFKITDIFTDKKKNLSVELDKIDRNVKMSYLQDLDVERNSLEKIQKDIIVRNEANIKALELAIQQYSPDEHNKKYTLEELDKQFAESSYNVLSLETYGIVKNRIRLDLEKIYKTHKRTYYISQDKKIIEKEHLEFDIEKFIPKEDPYFCWSHKGHRLSEMVFLNNVALDNNMDLVKLYYSPDKCIMFTSVSFTDFYRDPYVQKYFKDYGFLYDVSGIDNVINIVEKGVGSKKTCKQYKNDDYRKLITDKPAMTTILLKFNSKWNVPMEMSNCVKDKLFEAILAYIRDHPRRDDIVFVTSN